MIGVYMVDLPSDCTTMDDVKVDIRVFVNDDCIYMAEKEYFNFTVTNADEDLEKIEKTLKNANVKPIPGPDYDDFKVKARKRVKEIMGDLYETDNK